MTTTLSPAEILELPVEGESGADTLRGFFAAVLAEIWEDQKRVFGMSDWRYEAYEALGRAGLVSVEYDAHGYVEEMDRKGAEAIVRQVLTHLGGEARHDQPVYRKKTGVVIAEDRGDMLVLRNLSDGLTYEVSRAYFEANYGS